MIENTCSVCGLPKELCVCNEIKKESTSIEIVIERRKYGKLWAVVSGISTDISQLKSIRKEIKTKMACAGTIKGKNIEVLYGRADRTKELAKVLGSLGFNTDSIHVTNQRNK